MKKKSEFSQKGNYSFNERIEMFHVVGMTKPRKRDNFKRHSRITANTFKKRSKTSDVYLDARINEHRQNERQVKDTGVKVASASLEQILGRKENEKAFIRMQGWT